MKKNFCKLMALAVAALMSMSTMAFAENPAVDATDVAATTVSLEGLTAGEEATVLVVKAGTDLAALTNADIVYIDQVTIDADGKAAFTMDVSAAADAENGEIDMVDVYCGYTSMEGDALSALGIAIEEEVVAGPEFDLEKSQIKATSTFGGTGSMAGYKRVFLKITEPGAWTLAHSNEASEIYYSVEREGYDCMLVTEAATIEDVIAEITATQEAPVAQITLYGDISGDGKISAADTANIKKYILKTATNDSLGIKKLLAADASGDSKISAADTANFKKYILKTISEMPVANTNK